jgi:hypothetical protein
MNNRFACLASASLLLLVSVSSVQAQADITVSVGGEIKPGVYGRVVIGTSPPPPVIYPQPVIIVAPVVGVVQQRTPIYMHVPPGHSRKWSKHCYKYNACNQPVYFVKTEYKDDDHQGDQRGKEHGKRHDKGHSKGRGHKG